MKAARELPDATNRSWSKTQRLARHTLSRPAAVFHYEGTKNDPLLEVFTDSDWAGCTRSRKINVGRSYSREARTALKSWSTTQGPTSAEAQDYTMVEGAMKATEVKTLGGGGWHAHTDSSASKSFGTRYDCGCG